MRFHLSKKSLRPALLASALALGLGLGAAAQAQEKVRMGVALPTSHTSSQALINTFVPELEQQTGGALSADIFPDYQLGGAKENLDAVRSGALFSCLVGTSYLTRIVPEVQALSLPFVFSSREVAFRVLDGEVGELLNTKLNEKGFEVLAWMELGLRHLTNSVRPVASAKDFEGLKIRLQPNETHLATFQALGANPVSMDINELYQALQQGVVDGQENPYPVIDGNRFFEVQDYVSSTGHFFEVMPILANKRLFDNLPAEQQEALRDAAQKAAIEQRAASAEADEKALAHLQEMGMQFTEITPEIRAELREATAGVVDMVKEEVGAELVDQILAEVEKGV